eukprot:SAG22_NODE_38_length_26325_cov_107.302067_6_plen_54_part_00
MMEANDNVKFLKPLVPHLNKLRDTDEVRTQALLFSRASAVFRSKTVPFLAVCL